MYNKQHIQKVNMDLTNILFFNINNTLPISTL